jgi:hypothetical protein
MDILTKKITWLDNDHTNLGGWSFDGKFFLFSNKNNLFSCNVLNDGAEIIKLSTNSDTLIIDECYYLNPKELIYIAKENAIAKGKNIRDTEVSNDIVIYNLENDSVWFVFNDLRVKSTLAPYYSK